jgi:hypothetical protein
VPATQQGQPLPPPAWQTTTPPRKRRLLPILVLVFAIVLTGGGVAVAGNHFFGWFGGGSRPSDVIPGSAVSYVQVDLNPSLVQQASAWQFLHDLPQVKAAVAAGQPDPKAVAWKLLDGMADNPLSGVDYERDVKPWLGNRFGVSVLPKDESTAGVFAVQVTDEARAATTLRDWSAKADQHYDVTIRDGYALLTVPDDTSFVLKELDAGNLTRSQTFSQDFGTLGDPGVLAGWADLAGVAKLSSGAPANPFARGRGVFSLTFTSDTATLGGRLLGLDGNGVQGTTDLGILPASTWGAFGFSGGGDAVNRSYGELEPLIGDWISGAGLEKDDLVALLGGSFSVGVASTDGQVGLSSMPDVGVRIVTEDAARAGAALDKLSAMVSTDTFAVTHRVAADGSVVAATSEAYLSQLAEPTAGMSGVDGFAKALPNHANATASVYVSLAPFLTDPQWVSAEYRDFVTSLRGVGAEYVALGSSSGTWSVRVVRS